MGPYLIDFLTLKLYAYWVNACKNAVDSLAVLFGKPSFETLTKELEPLSERYDYVFRMNHVENMIRSLS